MNAIHSALPMREAASKRQLTLRRCLGELGTPQACVKRECPKWGPNGVQITPKRPSGRPLGGRLSSLPHAAQPLTTNDPGGSRTRDLRIKRKAGAHTASTPEYSEVCACSHLT